MTKLWEKKNTWKLLDTSPRDRVGKMADLKKVNYSKSLEIPRTRLIYIYFPRKCFNTLKI